jgi:hypothetical protein
MRRFLISAAAAVVAMMGAVMPSQAVTFAGNGTSLGSFNAAGSSLVLFEHTGLAAAGFTDIWTFTIGAGFTGTFEAASATNTPPPIQFTTFTLNPGASVQAGPFNFGFSNSISQTAVGALAAGVYQLALSGIAAAGAAYTGTFSITLAPNVNETPLPGALLLLGTVIAGGIGMRKLRQKRAQPAIA